MYGKIVELDILPLTNAIQRGYLREISDNVNNVNAPKKIEHLGVETEEVKSSTHADFNELIEVEVAWPRTRKAKPKRTARPAIWRRWSRVSKMNPSLRLSRERRRCGKLFVGCYQRWLMVVKTPPMH